MKEGWSPEQIAGRMKLEDHPIRVSHETICWFTYSNLGRSEELYRHLPEHRRKRRPRGMRKDHGQRIPQGLSIKERPDVVAKCKEFGYWPFCVCKQLPLGCQEADLIQFRKVFGKGNLGALVERLPGNAWQKGSVENGNLRARRYLP